MTDQPVHLYFPMCQKQVSISENKGAVQPLGYRTADHPLCFRYIDSTIHLLTKIKNFKPLAVLFGCTVQFMSELVGNREERFSLDLALMIVG